MRVIAASFLDRIAADRALARLRAEHRLAEDRIGKALLGTAGVGGPDVVLVAGRFADESVDAVRQALERMGGTIVADIDDARTEPERRLQVAHDSSRETVWPYAAPDSTGPGSPRAPRQPKRDRWPSTETGHRSDD